MAAGAVALRGRTGGVFLATVLLMSGCVPPDLRTPEQASRSTLPATPVPPPAVAVTRPVPEVPPTPEGTVEVPPPARSAPPASAATQALLTQSRGHQAAGRYEQAAASIERALRIEPRQPLLWLELGNIRLKEGDFAQAESLGRKALSLSAGDSTLTARAEQLIAVAKKH